MARRRTALVTGSSERVKAVGEALEGAGFAVTRLDRPGEVSGRREALASRSLDCYVQLPVDVPAGSGTWVDEARHFLAGGLLARFDTVSTVLPALAPGATVILVAGHRPPHVDTPDDPHARFDLLRVLARAIQAEMDDQGVRTVVVGSGRSPDDIAELVQRRGRAHWPDPRELTGSDPAADFDDWRREAISRSGPEDWELAARPAPRPARYLGWTAPGGRRAVVAVRGGIVSPLRLTDHGLPTGCSPSWGPGDPDRRPLARALLADTLRPHPWGERCGGGPAPCPACARFDRATDSLAEAFAAEVLGRVAPEHFELSARAIREWASGRSPGG